MPNFILRAMLQTLKESVAIEIMVLFLKSINYLNALSPNANQNVEVKVPVEQYISPSV